MRRFQVGAARQSVDDVYVVGIFCANARIIVVSPFRVLQVKVGVGAVVGWELNRLFTVERFVPGL